jgi:hypothetical protein
VFAVALGAIESVVNLLPHSRMKAIRRESGEFQRALESTTLDEARTSALAALEVGENCRTQSASTLPTGFPSSILDVFWSIQAS